jgi:hypothetical protein
MLDSLTNGYRWSHTSEGWPVNEVEQGLDPTPMDV